MKAKINALWFFLGAATLFVSLIVGLPMAAQALAPIAAPPAPPAPTPLAPPPVVPAPVPIPVTTPLVDAPMAIPSASPNPCSVPVSAGADWTTYTAPDGSFSFQYPASWNVIEEFPVRSEWGAGFAHGGVRIQNSARGCTGGTHLRPGFFRLNLNIYPHGLRGYADLNARLAAFDPPPPGTEVLERQEIAVGGQRAVRRVVKSPELSGLGADVTFAQGDTYFLVVGFYITLEFQPVFDRMVGSIVLGSEGRNAP